VKRLIQISDLNLSHPTDHLRSFKKGAIGHQWLAARSNMDAGDGMRAMEPIALANLGTVFNDPLTGLCTLLGAILLRQRLPCCKLLSRCAKQKKILHRLFLSMLEMTLPKMRSNAPLYITTNRYNPKRTFLQRRWT
jgi:hypothetical protein